MPPEYINVSHSIDKQTAKQAEFINTVELCWKNVQNTLEKSWKVLKNVFWLALTTRTQYLNF